MKNTLAIYSLVLFLFTHCTFATECTTNRISLNYINGIINTYSEANKNTAILNNDLDFKNLKFNVIYNKTQGKQEDLFQTFLQKYEEALDVNKEQILNEFRSSIFTQNKAFWYNAAIKKAEIRSLLEKTYSHAPLDDKEGYGEIYMYPILKEHLKNNEKVLVVSHSQGNLFANDFCKQAKKEFATDLPFINIQIATPASSIECGKSYFTFENDFVINGLRNLDYNGLKNIASFVFYENVNREPSEKEPRWKWITEFKKNYLSFKDIVSKVKFEPPLPDNLPPATDKFSKNDGHHGLELYVKMERESKRRFIESLHEHVEDLIKKASRDPNHPECFNLENFYSLRYYHPSVTPSSLPFPIACHSLLGLMGGRCQEAIKKQEEKFRKDL